MENSCLHRWQSCWGAKGIEKSQNSLEFGASWVEEKEKMGNGGGSGNRKHLVIQKR